MKRRGVRLAVGAALLLAWWGLMDTGFCVREVRYLSDRELIEATLRAHARDMKDLDGSEESIRRYLAAHPDCCFVQRDPQGRMLIDTLFGFNFLEVGVMYEQRKPYSPLEPFYEGRFHISACGRNPRREFGTGHAAYTPLK